MKYAVQMTSWVVASFRTCLLHPFFFSLFFSSVGACAHAPTVNATVADARASGASARPATPVPSRHDGRVEARDDDERRDEDCTARTEMDTPPGLVGLHVIVDARGTYGYADETGAVLIAPRFSFAYEFSKEGVASAIDAVTHRPLFLDRSGNEIAEAYSFDNGPDYFQQGRARIVKDGKVGFIDAHGNVIVRPTWDGATAFCRGIAAVCNGCRRGRGDEADVLEGGVWGVVDTSGRLVVPLQFTSDEEALTRARK